MDDLAKSLQNLDVDNTQYLIRQYFTLLDNYNFFEEDLKEFDEKWMKIIFDKSEFIKQEIYKEMYDRTSSLNIKKILFDMRVEEESHFYYLEMLLDHMVNLQNLGNYNR